MEKRIKPIGGYEKSGKCFINIDKRHKINDSISRNEYNVFQYENRLGLNYLNSDFVKLFDEKDILEYSDKIQSNESFNHSLRIFEYFKSKYSSNTSIIKSLPSVFPFENINQTLIKNQNIDINELEKYPNFLQIKQNKKTENVISNNSVFGKKFFNDTNSDNLYKKENVFTNQNSNFLKASSNPNSFQLYNKIETENAKRQNNLIEAKEEYTFLNQSQKKEKYFDINIIPTSGAKYQDLILQFLNPIMEESIDTNDEYIEFSGVQTYGSSLSKKRNTGDINDRRFYKFNTPFAIYNFSKNMWEYRGLIYPSYHLAKEYIENYLNLSCPSIDQQSIQGKNIVKILKLQKENLKIINAPNGFLDFFKKYFCYYCPLTNTPSVIIKRKIDDNYYESLLDFPFASIPTEQFGFPNHFKFHCFNDNLISMKKFIEKPFVLNRTSFSSDIEIMCEIQDEEGYYEEPINVCLNYFIIKQTEFEENINVNTDWSPVSLNKEANQIFISGSSNYFKEDLRIEKSTEVIDEKQEVIRVLNNGNIKFNYSDDNYENQFESGSLYDYNFYTNLNALSGSLDISTGNSKKYIREIVNFGNAVFLTPPKTLIEDYYPALGESYDYSIVNNQKFLNYISQENFDLLKIIDYPSHKKMLNDLDLTAILDFSGEISINSPCRTNTLIKNTINSHLFNFDFELSSGNNFEKLNINRTLNTINSGRSIGISTNTENSLLSTAITDNFGEVYIPSNLDERIYKNKYYAQEIKNLNSKAISPYVLYPEDNIALCVSISPIIHPKPIKQILSIKEGKCKFSLFGHFLQDEKKINDENDVLKNYNTNNFPNVIVGDILNTNEYSSFTNSNCFNFLDKIFTKEFDFKSGNRGLENISSKILKGKTFIPYIQIGNEYNLNTNEKFIYDDAFLQYTQDYKTQGTLNLVPTYYQNNIFENLLFYKKYDYELNNENFNESFINLNLKTFNCYFSRKRYGHLRDILEQRLYTTLYNIKNNLKEKVVEKQFINPDNGQILSDLTQVPNINKSLTYELINSGLTPVEILDVNIENINRLPYPFHDNIMRWNNSTWTLNEINKLKHVAFRENVNSVD